MIKYVKVLATSADGSEPSEVFINTDHIMLMKRNADTVELRMVDGSLGVVAHNAFAFMAAVTNNEYLSFVMDDQDGKPANGASKPEEPTKDTPKRKGRPKAAKTAHKGNE